MTARVELRDVEEADIARFFDHQVDPEAAAMASFPIRDWDTHHAHWRRILGDPMMIAQAVLLDGQLAGNIGSWLEDEKRLVGYWIGREYWGRGVATEALRLFAAECQERPLYAWVATSNVASTRVLEKVGFVPVGEPHVGSDGIEERLYVLR